MWEGFAFVWGAWLSENLQKLHKIIVLPVSIWGFGALFRRAKPTKTSHGDGTGQFQAKKCLQKHLKPLSKQFTCFCEHSHPTILATNFKTWRWKVFIFFPLPNYYLMMSERSYSWCGVSAFGNSLCCLCLWVNTCSVLRYHQSRKKSLVERETPYLTEDLCCSI